LAEIKVYQTGVNEKGRRFATGKLWKGHRVVDESLVEYQRDKAKSSPSEAERAAASEWVAEYEAAKRGDN
jgi:hypothetical protein